MTASQIESLVDLAWFGWKPVTRGSGIGVDNILGVADHCITYNSPRSRETIAPTAGKSVQRTAITQRT